MTIIMTMVSMDRELHKHEHCPKHGIPPQKDSKPLIGTKAVLLFIYSVSILLIVLILCLRLFSDKVTPNTKQPEIFESHIGVSDLTIEYGEQEKVYDYDISSCEEDDISDGPPRAFVDSSGNVQIVYASVESRRSIGTNLDTAAHQCRVLMYSHKNSDPTKFNDFEWVPSPYYLNGNVYTLIHNEFHGWDHGPGCTYTHDDCWYNSVTFATSTDEGVSYQHETAPSHTLLIYSSDYNPDNTYGPIGFFEPSNIFKFGNYYYFFATHHEPTASSGSCLFRTQTLDNTSSWTYWNGTDYSPVIDRKALNCTPIANVSAFVSVTYNEYLGKFFGMRCQWGSCWFSLSSDLIHWDTPQTFGDGRMCMYASIIQPGDETTNFEHSDRSPWIYFMTQEYCGAASKNRDVDRLRIRISTPEDVGKFDFLDLKFSEKAGAKSLDASFYGNNANLSGTYAWSADTQGRNYIHLDSGAYGTITHDNSLNASDKLTIEADVRLSQLPSLDNYARIIQKEQTDTGKRNYGFYINSEGKLIFNINDGSGYIGSSSTGTISAGQWYTIAITFDDGTNEAIYYINNVRDAVTTNTASLSGSQNTGTAIVGGSGFVGDIDRVTVENYISISASCICDNKGCGDDNGCGTMCTACPAGQTCNTTSGTCQTTCTPECTDRNCGTDGCGGSCGTCPTNETCNTTSGTCQTTCTAECTDRNCGTDGCGGSCGTCPTNQTCNTNSGTCQTTCTAECTDRNCGTDGCGGSCGTCPTNETCNTTGVCAETGSVNGDLNSDGHVSVSDYALFISDYIQYKKTSVLNNRSDFNSDEKISVSDYALFIQYYLDSIS